MSSRGVLTSRVSAIITLVVGASVSLLAYRPGVEALLDAVEAELGRLIASQQARPS